MKIQILFFLILILPVSIFSQTLPTDICAKLRARQEVPVSYSSATVLPMIPATCNALDNYGTIATLTKSPQSGYFEVYKQIRIVTETIQDGKTCYQTVKEIAREETETERVWIEPQNNHGPDVWTIRLELMTYKPNSRPIGCKVSQLPANHSFAGYWAITIGEFNSLDEAKNAVSELKRSYPEFCTAFAWLKPGNCDYEYSYIANSSVPTATMTGNTEFRQVRYGKID